MASRYDYSDPGQDSAYCDGLAAEDPLETAEPCAWCGDTDISHHGYYYPYCSPLCATQAAINSEDKE